jgi:hypothetical protein
MAVATKACVQRKSAQRKETDATDLLFFAHPAAGPAVVHLFQPDRCSLLNFLPTAHWPGVPDWVALVLCFWSVREFRRVGMGWAFVLGLLMDVADGAVLGQHCFAYVLLAYCRPRCRAACSGFRCSSRRFRSCHCYC